ncbi:glycosyltransferase [Elizabethkingia anophelis]|uniref:Glycosyl transferase family 2 n=1 Tax=Elizabethkingia anophelis R26 TaxID=1246994 RepID=A0ABM6MSP7_9FLAO|nr:glycosyltransferase [Elizabethkingia anophelis]ATC36126.1 glycosyl transferase family 2 [Elizabethkingia anophelis R26]ATC39803.1 glycosyl transferase family 2 [Elizabethkingia anophelis Ag1]ATC43482.1 glycosyl transferase family 2 [Elizabethkingia anophelis]ATC47158.1 glycosyl transferase family 2 [Elizabethkingia anophelis]ELR80721.1 family 2 glycosyl transferase [Elizabethkingia anophelis R26]
MKLNTVKILLATYNGEKYIKEQIDSILNQEGVDVSVSIADDGSKDDTINIIKNEYPNIEILINNPGTGSAANNFLKMIKTLDFNQDFEYVAFSDQDDVWLPKKMITAVNALNTNNAQLYCSNLTKWDTATQNFTELKKDFPQKKFDYLFEGGSAGCTYVFTKSFAKELRLFLEKIDYLDWEEFSHDWLVYFFARNRKYGVYIDSDSYIHYRIHDSNLHGHLNKLSFATIKEKFKQVLNGYHHEHARNYIKYVSKDSEEYKIYKSFLGNYFNRNKMILKYNTQLMRDNKKMIIFALLNFIKFK